MPERPPEIRKIVVKNWPYLPGVYTLLEDAKIPEIFGQNREKSICHRYLIKKSLNFLRNFCNFKNFYHVSTSFFWT